jgi:hypothetical protein
MPSSDERTRRLVDAALTGGTSFQAAATAAYDG